MSEQSRSVPRLVTVEERLAHVEATQREQSTVLKEHGRMLREIHGAIVKNPMSAEPGGIVGEQRQARAELDDLGDRVTALESARKSTHDRIWQIVSMPIGAILGALGSALASQWRGHP